MRKRMDKQILAEMGKRYPLSAPIVVMEWAGGAYGINCLTHLNNLIDDNEICIELIDPSQVQVPIISGSWKHNPSRGITVRFPMGIALKDDSSLNILSSGGLEGMRMLNEGPARGLMSSSLEEQEEVAGMIIKDCLSSDFVGKLSEWKIIIRKASLETYWKELPGIRFVFEYRLGKIMNVLIDGWSGSILVDGAVQRDPYISGKHFHELIGLIE